MVRLLQRTGVAGAVAAAVGVGKSDMLGLTLLLQVVAGMFESSLCFWLYSEADMAFLVVLCQQKQTVGGGHLGHQVYHYGLTPVVTALPVADSVEEAPIPPRPLLSRHRSTSRSPDPIVLPTPAAVEAEHESA